MSVNTKDLSPQGPEWDLPRLGYIFLYTHQTHHPDRVVSSRLCRSTSRETGSRPFDVVLPRTRRCKSDLNFLSCTLSFPVSSFFLIIYNKSTNESTLDGTVLYVPSVYSTSPTVFCKTYLYKDYLVYRNGNPFSSEFACLGVQLTMTCRLPNPFVVNDV